MKLLHTMIEKEQAPEGDFLLWLRQNRLKGMEKLFVTKKLLPFRKTHQPVFLQGAYLPLIVVNGERKVVAYARHWQDKWILVIVPVGIAQTATDKNKPAAWDKLAIELPEEAPALWRHIFTGQELRRENGLLSLQPVFALFPVAVLEA